MLLFLKKTWTRKSIRKVAYFISIHFVSFSSLLFVHSPFLFYSDCSVVYFCHLSFGKFNFGNNINFQCVNDAKYFTSYLRFRNGAICCLVRHSIGLRKRNHNTMSFVSILSLYSNGGCSVFAKKHKHAQKIWWNSNFGREYSTDKINSNNTENLLFIYFLHFI